MNIPREEMEAIKEFSKFMGQKIESEPEIYFRIGYHVENGHVTYLRCFQEHKTMLKLKKKNQVDKLALPQSLGNLIYLKDLSISHCYRPILPESLVNCKDLEVLNLSDNYLTELPNFIASFKKLRDLYVDRNDFEKIPPVLLKLPNLEFLQLKPGKLNRVHKVMVCRALGWGMDRGAYQDRIGALIQAGLVHFFRNFYKLHKEENPQSNIELVEPESWKMFDNGFQNDQKFHVLLLNDLRFDMLKNIFSAYIFEGNYEKAVELGELWAPNYDHSGGTGIRNDLLFCHFKLGNIAATERHLQNAKFKYGLYDIFKEALLILKEQYKEAEINLKQVLKKGYYEDLISYILGDLYFRQKKWKDAKMEYEKSLEKAGSHFWLTREEIVERIEEISSQMS